MPSSMQLLRITDGTDTINLLSKVGPFRATSWFPSTQELKDGGVWQGGSFTDGGRLVAFSYSDGQETINIAIHSHDIDEIFTAKQTLTRLLIKAMQYWTTSWQSQPVWIEARASGETNTRYAIVKAGRVAGGSDQVNTPLISRRVNRRADMLEISLVRGFWQDSIPGLSPFVGTLPTLDTSSDLVFHAVSSGRTSTALDEVFFANHNVLDNIAYVWYQVHGGGAFSANLQSAVDRDLLPNPIVAADCVYFGGYKQAADCLQFTSLIFDIKTAVGGGTGVWEIWTGAAWVAIAVFTDETAGFTLTGVRFLTFTPNAGWATTAINGITTYWIRWRVTVGGAFVPPVQQNRWIYSVKNGSFKVNDENVPGDVTSQIRLQLHQHGAGPAGGAGPDVGPDRLILGLRSVNRGPDFTAFLNLQISNTNGNPALINVVHDVGVTDVSSLGSPNGLATRYAPGAATTNPNVANLNSGPLDTDFYGSFHVYVRATIHTGGTGDGLVCVTFYRNKVTTFLDYVPLIAPLVFQMCDMGVITLDRLETNLAYTPLSMSIWVGVKTTTVPAVVDLYDLILIPIDEWSGDLYGGASSMRVHGNFEMDIDSISSPRVPMTCVRRDTSLSTYDTAYQPRIVAPMGLQPNTDQRMWGLASRTFGGGYMAYPQIFWSIRAHQVVRYLTNRGRA